MMENGGFRPCLLKTLELEPVAVGTPRYRPYQAISGSIASSRVRMLSRERCLRPASGQSYAIAATLTVPLFQQRQNFERKCHRLAQ